MLKAVYGFTPSGTSPLLVANRNNLITDKEEFVEGWAEHFIAYNSVLDSPSP